MSSTTELQRLAEIASDSWYAKGVSGTMIQYTFRIFSRYLQPDRVLELGPAEGIMTALLAPVSKHLTIVDGSAAFCDDLRKRFPQATVFHSLFEQFRTDQRFDTIVLGHVLEHVIDPVEILSLAKTWLAPQGRVLAAVPNARSLHRQAAVIMGTGVYSILRASATRLLKLDSRLRSLAATGSNPSLIGRSRKPGVRKWSRPLCSWASVTPTSLPKTTSSLAIPRRSDPPSRCSRQTRVIRFPVTKASVG